MNALRYTKTPSFEDISKRISDNEISTQSLFGEVMIKNDLKA